MLWHVRWRVCVYVWECQEACRVPTSLSSVPHISAASHPLMAKHSLWQTSAQERARNCTDWPPSSGTGRRRASSIPAQWLASQAPAAQTCSCRPPACLCSCPIGTRIRALRLRAGCTCVGRPAPSLRRSLLVPAAKYVLASSRRLGKHFRGLARLSCCCLRRTGGPRLGSCIMLIP
jgi:hypothetical protein